MTYLKSLILILFISGSSFAQSLQADIAALPVGTPDPLHHEYARDTSDVDPDKAQKFELDEVVHQGQFAIEDVPHDVIRWAGDEIDQLVRGYQHIVKRRSELFDLFKVHEARYQPSEENGLALINADFDFAGISDRKMGYCWGFATLIREFVNLAFFEPTAKRESLDFYQNQMDELTRGKAVLIPGFKNIREFTLVPEHLFYLTQLTMELWRKYAIRPSSLALYSRTTKQMPMDELQDLLQDLKLRLARHELPKIFISSQIQSPGLIHFSKYVHIVLVVGVEQNDDGSAKIKLWDGNFFAETQMRDPKVIEITKSGDLIYQPWIEPGTPTEAISNRLSRISIPPENDAETIQQLFSLRKFCRAHSDRCK